jgi:L-amino acid N-acyltransferase YncA
MTPGDWADVARIYEEGIQTGNATFETEVPQWEEWDAGHLEVCRLVMEEDGVIVGWAALSAVSRREVYRGVAEHSIYVADSARGRGVGTELLGALVADSEEAGFWTLQTAIFPENEASIGLHERHGFRVVGVREGLGRHHGRWRDVVLMERRSAEAGQ